MPPLRPPAVGDSDPVARKIPILHHVLWLRPSTLLLALVLAANAVLALLHLRTDEGPPADSRPIAEPQDVERARTVEPAGPIEAPAAAEAPVTVHTPPVQPVEVPPIERRSIPAPRPAVVCRAWGPFPEQADAAELVERLALPEDSYRIVESEVAVHADYLVTIRGAEPRRAAAQLIEQLASQEIETHLLDRPGVVLAAGVFRSAARAEAQQRRLLELGYDATVEPLERTERAFHLLARVAADRPVGGAPGASPSSDCSEIAPSR